MGGGKGLRTYRLLNHMIDWGLFEPFDQVGHTVFGVKPPSGDFARFDLAQCRQTLAELDRERSEVLGTGCARVT